MRKRSCRAYRSFLEAPLADFQEIYEIETWLKGKPREVAIALAARAALRVLPFVQEVARYDSSDILLPVFRALATAWAAGK